jgi:uncharacterized protein
VDWPSIPNDHQVIWTPWDSAGMEHLRLSIDENDNIIADGVILGIESGLPFRIRYSIGCDRNWSVREVKVSHLDPSKSPTTLLSNGRGDWVDWLRNPMPRIAGCTEIDLSVSPFTNTIPIRRLNLGIGEPAEIEVVYFKLPGFQVNPVRQRYTLLKATTTGRTYRYESIDSGYTADLPVDEYGLVIDYPEAWRRVERSGTS